MYTQLYTSVFSLAWPAAETASWALPGGDRKAKAATSDWGGGRTFGFRGGRERTSVSLARLVDTISLSLSTSPLFNCQLISMVPPITPDDLSRAVALLIAEKSSASSSLKDAKDTNLRELYAMIRSVVKGNGMRAVDMPVSEEEGTGEAWEMFKNDAKWQDGKVDIVLPDFEDVLKSSQEDEEQVEHDVLIDSPAPPTYTPIVIPIPTISTTQRQVYTPRFPSANHDRPKWINGAPNSAAYEPPLDPRVFPLPATGHATALAFDPPVETQDVISLESAYAANLHPLPHLQQGQRHRQKRDRTRSDGAAAISAAGGVGKGEVDNTSFGNWSFGVPPAYVQPSTRRQKVEAFQQSQGTKDPIPETTINPVLANPLDATTSLSTDMDGKTLTNPIQSSTLAPATKDIHAAKGKGMDLYELGVGFRVNPVSRGMKKTNKCVTSRDWQVSPFLITLWIPLMLVVCRRRMRKSST